MLSLALGESMKGGAAGRPLDDIRRLIAALPEEDAAARAAVQRRDAALTKPPGSLGRLEEIAAWVAAWQARERPSVARSLVAVFAANHGIAGRGVSAYPRRSRRRWWRTFPPAAPPSTRSAPPTASG